MYSSLSNMTGLLSSCVNTSVSTERLQGYLYSYSARTLYMGSKGLLDMVEIFEAKGLDLIKHVRTYVRMYVSYVHIYIHMYCVHNVCKCTYVHLSTYYVIISETCLRLIRMYVMYVHTYILTYTYAYNVYSCTYTYLLYALGTSRYVYTHRSIICTYVMYAFIHIILYVCMYVRI